MRYQALAWSGGSNLSYLLGAGGEAVCRGLCHRIMTYEADESRQFTSIAREGNLLFLCSHYSRIETANSLFGYRDLNHILLIGLWNVFFTRPTIRRIIFDSTISSTKSLHSNNTLLVPSLPFHLVVPISRSGDTNALDVKWTARLSLPPLTSGKLSIPM